MNRGCLRRPNAFITGSIDEHGSVQFSVDGFTATTTEAQCVRRYLPALEVNETDGTARIFVSASQ